MLGQRVITAVILLAVLAATLASGNPWWFVALLAVGAACACWEWLRLTVAQPPSRPLCVGVAAALLALMLWLTWAWLAGQPAAAGLQAAVVRILVPLVALAWLLGST
ncbi:phosphatidate cytidylyltransferase [Bordetella petrii]|nr:phosphatidate cytidylyltransferase [Bordetella petrii]MCD0504572.1 phosphatidate cytidylyltransferase [Bordetella petrii]